MAQFPGVAFHLANHLSAHQLTGADVVFLGVIGSPTSGIKPLSKTEQSVLLSFVQHGGTAVLFTDNDTFASNAKAVNSSLLKPFSLAATGTRSSGRRHCLESSPRTASQVSRGSRRGRSAQAADR
jgi:hypothetical protein